MNMPLRLALIPLALVVAAAPVSAGHRQRAGSESSIILQRNVSTENLPPVFKGAKGASHDQGGIILQNRNRYKAIRSNGGIILQNQNRGGIILQNHDRSKAIKGNGGIILQNQNRGGIILQNQNRGGIILQHSTTSTGAPG